MPHPSVAVTTTVALHVPIVDADLVTDLFTLAGIRVLNNEGFRRSFRGGHLAAWLALKGRTA